MEAKQDVLHDERHDSAQERSPKLDQHGFPLRPQPSDDPKGEKDSNLHRPSTDSK